MDKGEVLKQFINSNVSTISDSSSSDSSTDDSDTYRIKRTRIEGYVEEVVPHYMCFEFQIHFRMSRGSFEKLNEIIQCHKKNVGGWPPIAKDKQILLTLWYLANQESFRQVSDRFGITQSACYSTISDIIQSLVDMRRKYIKWPARNSYAQIAAAFQEKKGIPNVLGAIDGSHISINRPTENAIDYVNRKGTHSILFQGAVDNKKLFIDVFCGEPGSIHDARLLRKSNLYIKACADDHYFKSYFLLGDSAYPSLNWLIPPYKDNGFLTPNQKDFNYSHSATRIVVENAFSLLKGRFRRLKHFDNKRIDFITKCVVAATILHNFCILCNEDALDIDDDLPMEDDNDEIVEASEAAFNRRNEIFNMLYL